MMITGHFFNTIDNMQDECCEIKAVIEFDEVNSTIPKPVSTQAHRWSFEAAWQLYTNCIIGPSS